MLLILMIMILVSIRLVRHWPFNLKLAFFVFWTAYFFTVFIGAALVALPNHAFALNIVKNYGISTTLFSKKISVGYWFLLCAPLFLPFCTALFLKHCYYKPIEKYHPFLSQPVNLTAYWCALATISLYLWMILARDFRLPDLITLFNHASYKKTIILRALVADQYGPVFYPLLYMTLPTLSQIALFQWHKTHCRRWGFTFLLSALQIIIIVLATLQKGPIIVYAVSIALGLFVLNPKRIYLLLMGGLAGILLITSYQYLILSHHWHILNSIYLIIFRTAISFPFYYFVYPDVIPFTGPDLALDLLGLAQHPAYDNLIIFHYMYPYVQWIQGAAAAPAHMVAYSQGGYTLAVVTLILIGVLIWAIGMWGGHLSSPIQFAFFTQNLVSLYWLTQVPLRSALLTGYGLFWSLAGLTLVWIYSIVFEVITPKDLFLNGTHPKKLF